jgi:NAD dependent epimerase/dehydratase family enzyme
MAELLVHYVMQFSPGVINATAPEPQTNAQVTEVLADKFHRSAIFHVPEFVLSKLPGDFGREMLLASVRAVPKRALADGFSFTFEHLADAVEDLI